MTAATQRTLDIRPNGAGYGRVVPVLGFLALAGILLLGLAAPAAIAAPKSPVAAYSFDEGSGTTAGDSTGNHDGTIEGGASWVEGKYGSALQFDGANDRIVIPDSSELDFSETFTLEAWVRPDTLKDGSVITKAQGTGLKDISGYWLNAARVAEKPSGVTAELGTIKSVEGPSALPTGEWSHLALVSYEGEMFLFVDGELVDTGEGLSVPAGSGPLKIGQSLSGWFDGLIDEVALYDRALSEEQIQADMATPMDAVFNAEGSQLTGVNSGGHAVLQTGGGQFVFCTSAPLAGISLAEPQDTLTGTPSYGNCTGTPWSQSVTINTNGCNYTFDSGISAVGTMDIVGCSGAGITFTTLACTYTIPPQSGIGPVEYATIGTGSEREIRITADDAEYEYSFSGGCGSGTTSSIYNGVWEVSAANEVEEQVGAWMG
jgi:Concanavalin A-like lectin/glucanases superfamily